jgi:hypothetical protein
VIGAGELWVGKSKKEVPPEDTGGRLPNALTRWGESTCIESAEKPEVGTVVRGDAEARSSSLVAVPRLGRVG